MCIIKRMILFLMINSTVFYGANEKNILFLLGNQPDIQTIIAKFHTTNFCLSSNNQSLHKDLQFFYLWRSVSLTSKILLAYFGHPTKSLMQRLKDDSEFQKKFHSIATITLSMNLPVKEYFNDNLSKIKIITETGNHALFSPGTTIPEIWKSFLSDLNSSIDLESTYYSSTTASNTLQLEAVFDLFIITAIKLHFKPDYEQVNKNLHEYLKILLTHYEQYPDSFVYRGETNMSFGDRLFRWYLQQTKNPISKKLFDSTNLWMPLFYEFIFSKDLASLAINQELIQKNPSEFQEFKQLFISYHDLFLELGTIEPRIPPLKAIQLKVLYYLIMQGIPKEYS